MATKYTRPQSEVHQLLDVTQQATGDHLAACIVAPQYDLYRYGTEETEGAAFNAAESEQVIPFSFAQEAGVDYEVDKDSVSLYAKGLEAVYQHSYGTTAVVDASNSLILRTHSANIVWAASVDLPEGYTRVAGTNNVQVGDIVRVSASSNAAAADCTASVVEGLVGAVIAPNASLDIYAGSQGTAVSGDLSVDVSGYTSANDTSLILVPTNITDDTPKVITNVLWTVTDVKGTTVATGLQLSSSEKSIGATGIKIKTTSTTAKVNADATISIVVDAAKESDTLFDGLLLSNIPIDLADKDNINTLYLSKPIEGLLENVEGKPAVYTVSDDSVTVAQGMAVTIGGTQAPIANGIGELYPQFRVLKKYPEDDDIIEIATIEDIQENFGTIDVFNDIAKACETALLGAGGRSIFAFRTRGTDRASFNEALKKSQSNKDLYSFVPVTTDKEIFEDFVAFNNAMSAPEVKMWRRSIVGVDAPGEYTLAAFDNNAARLTCSVFPDATGKFTLLQCDNAYADAMSFNFKEVRFHGSIMKVVPGDKIKVGNKLYTIATVSSKSVGLRDALPTALTKAPFSVVKADTAENIIEYVGAFAKSVNTRRALVVFCDDGVTFDANDKLVHVSNKYLAAEIAGISSAVVPQQSITRTEIGCIKAAPNMYTRFTQAQLDKLASMGVLIVTQDHKNTVPYIRHQLTTEMDKGNLYFEDSCTRNIDSISYDAADIIDRYIGKANVTPSALRRIKNELEHLYTEKTAVQPTMDPDTAALVGPQLVDFANLTVVQDQVFKDRVVARVSLYLPLPMNGVRLYEMAYVATVSI